MNSRLITLQVKESLKSNIHLIFPNKISHSKDYNQLSLYHMMILSALMYNTNEKEELFQYIVGPSSTKKKNVDRISEQKFYILKFLPIKS